ncbi:methylmalonyl-CoA mutase [Roseovarius sp. TM1035]|uniref:Uncharacterized protein n=1 Tax=Roseovarius mucosus TaxID=215743 RepID=A0A1V0RL72_9RHOB|nr:MULTISPECIES: hypothetical protein [Roseovarius]ARE82533.1 hypothetical protein ROSMUCSMR3_01038 [Roseovarius mucosus]AWZ22611.1 Hypothetical protein RAK1035_3906 [Roseovarius sp. AK1035]EDM32341.1 methylmalonyl-CoA mutase [Roseovarius sp. TM1035]MBW4973752.1 hypothetical protein [Roseovarius mucosus]
MSETAARPAMRKSLTLPRSFSRVLGRLLILPATESLPLANNVYAQTSNPVQRALAMRLRLRLLQEALDAPHKPVPPVKAEPEPLPPPMPEPMPEPEPEPAPPPKPAKTAKLVSLDLAGGALSMMMSELGSGEDAEDDFFGDD